ncbi:hypothetical protein ADUPG1_010189 [Aduncisulcus paluster]|uniref:Uncharacterized protein n=1 Tax=Aduncisulcus paluster TaxID=2918883 RepID=A0ABQ5JQW3_9EUKA|nr:hypothetical protein ADUPG1_010189 [Aduncisulcus paluster]
MPLLLSPIEVKFTTIMNQVRTDNLIDYLILHTCWSHIRPQRQCSGLLKADVEILVDTSCTTAVIKTTEEEIEEAQC